MGKNEKLSLVVLRTLESSLANVEKKYLKKNKIESGQHATISNPSAYSATDDLLSTFLVNARQDRDDLDPHPRTAKLAN